MKRDGATFIVLRIVFGCYFILQGICQTDYLGPKYFPDLNRHFVEKYSSDYHASIPWKSFGLNVTASTFRQTIGYILIISGVSMTSGIQATCATNLMSVVAIWSVYAHIVANDPTYYALCGAVIALVMIFMSFGVQGNAEQKKKAE